MIRFKTFEEWKQTMGEHLNELVEKCTSTKKHNEITSSILMLNNLELKGSSDLTRLYELLRHLVAIEEVLDLFPTINEIESWVLSSKVEGGEKSG